MTGRPIDRKGSDDGLENIPASCLPGLARLAGCEDIPGFGAAMAALFHSALDHDASVFSCQFSTQVFERDGASTDAAVLAIAGNISVQAIVPEWSGQLQAFATKDLPFFGEVVGGRVWPAALVLSLRYNGGFGASIVLYRTAAQGAFEPHEVDTIRLLAPICQQTLDRLFDQQRTRALQKNLIGFLHDLPVGLIMIDWDRLPIFINREGYRQALLWNCAPDPPPRRVDAKAEFHLPADIYEVTNAFMARWQHRASPSTAVPMLAGATDTDLAVTIRHPARPDMRASITASHVPEGDAEPPKYLVRFFGLATRDAAEYVPTPEQLKLLAQLTPTERTIAMLVAQGLSNREIADRLHREISTIKDHMTHVFDKLSIRSRVQLATMLHA